MSNYRIQRFNKNNDGVVNKNMMSSSNPALVKRDSLNNGLGCDGSIGNSSSLVTGGGCGGHNQSSSDQTINLA